MASKLCLRSEHINLVKPIHSKMAFILLIHAYTLHLINPLIISLTIEESYEDIISPYLRISLLDHPP